MIRESLKLDTAINTLNRFLLYDRDAMSDLFLNMASECNENLAQSPTVQVRSEGGGYKVAILGVLNGLFGVFDIGPKKGWGPITMIVDDGKIMRFERTQNEEKE